MNTFNSQEMFEICLFILENAFSQILKVLISLLHGIIDINNARHVKSD